MVKLFSDTDKMKWENGWYLELFLFTFSPV